MLPIARRNGRRRQIDIPAEFEQDLPDASDEHLLATLGCLAAGFEDDGDVLSSGILDFLPAEVQLADPSLKAMIEECGALLELYLREVERKNKFHRQRLVEVIKARESCIGQAEEARVLRDRLLAARSNLTEKLEQEYLAEQKLRHNVEQHVKVNRGLNERLTDGVQRLEKRWDELSGEIAQEDGLQASLMQQLQASQDEEARLRSALESVSAAMALEKVRDDSRKAALAKENADARTAHERLRSELSEVERSRRSSLAAVRSALGEDDGSSDLEPDECSPEAGDGEDHDEVSDNERAIRCGRMERRFNRQQERLAQIRMEIGCAESSTAAMESQMDQLEAAAAAAADTVVVPAASPAEAEQWVPEMGEDVVAMVREVDEKVLWLRDGADERRAKIDNHRQLQDTLDAQVAELSELQEAIASTEASCAACDRAIEDLRAAVSDMSIDIERERETLREEEWSSQRRRHTFRLQVDEQRMVLQNHREANRTLMSQKGRKKKRSFSAKCAR